MSAKAAEEFIEAHLNVYWLRPESALWDAIASSVISRADFVTPSLDLGSGNGFPGVSVAALHPGASVVLLDRTGKKVRAMGSCLLTARLDGVETMHLDAAQAPALRRDLRHAFDLVVARAVSRPAALAELADPLLRPGGHLVLWLEADAELPQRLGGMRRAQALRYDLPEPAVRQRVLGHWRKGS